MNKYLSSLKKCELPSETDIELICHKAKEILITEDNLVQLVPPITICGDIHGQFYDLLELFQVGDDCPKTNYCFMGDYVDRGMHSIETFLYLIVLKICYPTHMTLLRGNHESRITTQSYGFYDECIKKFGSVFVYNHFIDVFDLLPIGAVINGYSFIVHGGLSPQLSNISNINNLYRNQEIPAYGIVSDLVWSDPEEDQIDDWAVSSRGIGFIFNANVVSKFNFINGISCIFRSHQMVNAGYHYMFNQALCIVWSAPNYCYSCGNYASILEIDENTNRFFNIFKSNPSSHTENELDRSYNDFFLKPAYFL